jgi:hypothetical protein
MKRKNDTFFAEGLPPQFLKKSSALGKLRLAERRYSGKHGPAQKLKTSA